MTRLRSLMLLALWGPLASAADPGKDTLGDPLPENAKARFGTERLRNLDTYGATQLSPDGKSLIGSISSVYQYFDLATGKPTGKFGTGKLQTGTFSGDGKRVATGGYQALSIWEVESGKVISEIKRTTYISNTPGDISLSHDGKRIAFSAAVDDKKKAEGVSVSVYDVDGNKEIAFIKVAQNNRGYVTLSGDGKTLMTWGYHNTEAKAGEKPEITEIPSNWIQFWDVDTKKELSTLKFNYVPTSKIMTRDGLTAITCFGDGLIRFWDTRTGKLKREFIGRTKAGIHLILSDDDKTLASVCADGAVQLWNVTDGKSLSVTACPFNAGYFAMHSFRFTGKDSAVLLSVMGTTKVAWEIPTGKVLTTLAGHTEGISSIVFTNDDKEIWTSSESGNTLKWSPEGKELGTVNFKIPGAPAATERITASTVFHSTGAFAIRKETYGNEFGIFDLPSGTQRTFLTIGEGYSNAAHLSANGQFGAVIAPPAYSDKPKPFKVVCFDMNAEIKSRSFELPPGTANESRMTQDGKLLVINREVKDDKGKSTQVTTAYELPTGKQLGEGELKGYYGGPKLSIHPDGKSLFVQLEQGDHAVYGLPELKKERSLKYNKSNTRQQISTNAVFSQDGNKLAVAYTTDYGSRMSTIDVFDWKSGEITHTFKGHTANVTAMAFSKDGKTLATGSYDTTVLLWDLGKK